MSDPLPLVVGARVATSRSVTQGQIDAYARVSGDNNPLHTDPAFAATTSLGGTVAHGMLILAWLSDLLADSLGERWAAGGAFRIRFRAPARPGDRLELAATVRSIQDTTEGRRATLDVIVVNERQEVIIDGTATVGGISF